MKKILNLITFASIATLSLLFLPTFAIAQSDTGWDIDSFHSDLTIQQDGTVQVNETIAVDFHSLEKHGIYRDIPFIYNQNGSSYYTKIDGISVRVDGQPSQAQSYTSGNYEEIKIGDPKYTISGKHTYTINYTATGILRGYDKYDELYWNVSGDKWPVTINQASATVTLPSNGIVQSACYEGQEGSVEQCTSATSTAKSVSYQSSQEVIPGANFTVAVGYTKGMVPLLTAAQPPSLMSYIFSPITYASFAVFAVLGVGLIVWNWWRKGRDQKDPGQAETIIAEYTPPLNMRPGEIDILLTENFSNRAVTATLVDLAVRGYLTITELQKESFLSQDDYQFDQLKASDDALLEYEKTFLNQLFVAGKQVKLSDLRFQFVGSLVQIKKQANNQVVARGLFTQDPSKVTGQYYAIAFLLFFFPVWICLYFWTWASSYSILTSLGTGLALGMVVSGITQLIFAKSMPARTPAGTEAYRKAKGYELFINTTEKYRAQFAEKENLFYELLPYAIVFGATKKLVESMKQLNIQPTQPYWYRSYRPIIFTDFDTRMTALSGRITSDMATTPSSSGSGGGGFSGGGFGGGGGGSW